MYNDEDPATGEGDERKAHSKGVVILNPDDGSAAWLQHSVPRFPHTNASIPHAQTVYGQHFMCLQVRRSARAYTCAKGHPAQVLHTANIVLRWRD